MASNAVEIVIGAKDKTKGAFKSVGAGLKTLAIGAAGVGVAIGAAGAAIGAIAKSTAAAGDQFHKMSLRLGVGVEALSELKHAAELSGSSIEDVEGSFRVLSKQMKNASDGLTASEEAFTDLGISVTDSKGKLKSADAVFMEAVDALNALGSETEKTARAQELFGRGGTALLPMIKSGAAGIAEMRKEAQALGITFSQVEADDAAAFSDAIDRVGKTFEGMKNIIGKEVIPILAVLAENFATTVKGWLPAIKNFVHNSIVLFMAFPDIVQVTMNTAKDIIYKLFTDTSYLKTFLTNVGKYYVASFKMTGEVLLQVSILIAKVAAIIFVPFGTAFRVVASQIRKIWQGSILSWQTLAIKAALNVMKALDNLPGISIDMDPLKESLVELENLILEPALTFEEAWHDSGEVMGIIAGSMKNNFSAMGDSVGNFGEKLGETFRAAAESEDIVAYKEKISDVLDEASERIADFSTGAKANLASITGGEGGGEDEEDEEEDEGPWAKWLGKTQTAMEQFKGLTRQTWKDFSTGFKDSVMAIIKDGGKLGKALANLMKSIATSVISTLIQIGVERLVQWVISKIMAAARGSSELGVAAGTTFANAYAWMAAINPFAAAGFAAGHVAVMLAGTAASAASGSAKGSVLGGALHGGLSNVPAESTYLLDKGERVLSPNQNTDLESFMGNGGRGGGTTINVEEIQIMPGANIDEALFDKPLSWWQELTREKILPALNELGEMNYTTTLKYETIS